MLKVSPEVLSIKLLDKNYYLFENIENSIFFLCVTETNCVAVATAVAAAATPTATAVGVACVADSVVWLLSRSQANDYKSGLSRDSSRGLLLPQPSPLNYGIPNMGDSCCCC